MVTLHGCRDLAEVRFGSCLVGLLAVASGLHAASATTGVALLWVSAVLVLCCRALGPGWSLACGGVAWALVTGFVVHDFGVLSATGADVRRLLLLVVVAAASSGLGALSRSPARS